MPCSPRVPCLLYRVLRAKHLAMPCSPRVPCLLYRVLRAKHLAMPCSPRVPCSLYRVLRTSLEDQRGLGPNQHCHSSSPACGASVTTGVDCDVPTDHQCIATCKEKRNNYYYCQISSTVKVSSMPGTILGPGNTSLNQNKNSCPRETHTLVKYK